MAFIHSGHRSKLTDLDWNPNEHLTLASTEEVNLFQAWRMNTAQYA